MKRIEQIQTTLKKNFENKLVAHITHEFSKANIALPLPKFRDGMATYDEPAAAKNGKSFTHWCNVICTSLG